jgi:hypothetical protein
LRLDLESRGVQGFNHCRCFEEAEVKINVLSPELINVSDLITDVEGNEQPSAGNQYPVQFATRG